MKNLALFLILLPFLCWSQESKEETLMHDGLEREYFVYVPAAYDGETAVPLLFNFHGFGSNAQEQRFYGDFRPLANEANFILVHPEGTLFNEMAHWNVGGFTTGSTVDDIGFTEAMIETLSAEYNIDANRIYSTGMSNGGYMSFLLACQLSDKIAAIASVTGSMSPNTYDNCDAQHPTPVLQIHGTQDETVPYAGAAWTRSIEDIVDFWVDYNGCNPVGTKSDVENSNTTDGTTVEHYVYSDCEGSVLTEHYKILGGTHTWPGSIIPFEGTNYDINASKVIWDFLSKFDINGLISTTSATALSGIEQDAIIYPNPTNSYIHIDKNSNTLLQYEVLSSTGQSVLLGTSSNGSIDLSQLPANLYFVRVDQKLFKVMKID